VAKTVNNSNTTGGGRGAALSVLFNKVSVLVLKEFLNATRAKINFKNL
jgi:hypothetical protein